MKKFFLFLLFFAQLMATPTALFWTNTTTDIQGKNKLLIGLNTYFSLFNAGLNRKFIPDDIGLLIGLFDWKKLKGEVGIDYLESVRDPILFNGKIGMDEGVLWSWAPSYSLGLFNVGTQPGLTNQNIVNFVLGKKLSKTRKTRLFISAYAANKAIGRDRTGISVGFDFAMNHVEAKDGVAAYDKWLFTADYCTGKNVIGGGGIGINYFFTPDVSLITGPVFFNDKRVNGSWKWTFQLYVDHQF